MSSSPGALRGAYVLAREAALLVATGGFGRTPDPRITTAVGSVGLPSGDDPAARRTALADADAEGRAVLGSLGTSTPDVQRALGPLSTTDLAALAGGRAVSVTSEEYLRALDHLLHSNGGPPAAMAPPDPALIAGQLRDLAASPPPASPASEATTTAPAGVPLEQAATDQATDAGSSSPAVPLLLAVLAVAVIAGGAVWLRRRPAAPPQPAVSPRASAEAPTRPALMNGAMQNLLDVSRRLTSEAASGDIDRAVVRHALQLVPAHGAALVRLDGDDLVVGAETHPGLMVAERLGEGAVHRVAETGQPIVQISATEPAIRNLPASLAAFPLVGGGRVQAVLVLLRSDIEPFTGADREVLLALAPVAAAALHNAGQARAAIEQSLVDPLTGVGNRRRFDMDLARAVSGGDSTALFMVDLDHFKKVNDAHGHPAGDALLQGVSSLMRDGVRPGDTVYRFGGEEFCVLLQRTSREEATEVAERVRRSIADRRFGVGKPEPLRATASFGVSAADDRDGAALVARADEALYAAKQSGRNRVEIR